MNGDLLVIVPSRGRPNNITRLLDAVHRLRKLNTHVHVAVDDDDPQLGEYEKVFGLIAGEGDHLEVGHGRMGLAAWTNKIAVKRAHEYRCLASFGDDHVPRTPGWDKALVEACVDMNPGIAYPWDGLREDIPEAVVMSSEIVTALGWMCEPTLQHYYVDNVWADLGRGAGCLRHLRAIAVDHAHPNTGMAQGDATYVQASPKIPVDKEAWKVWRRERMADDIATVKALTSAAPVPV